MRVSPFIKERRFIIMFATKIRYKDFNGVEREEIFRFHITETEIAEMEMTYDGGLKGVLQRIIDASDKRQIIEAFKKLILDSYGIKSPDGRSFMKNEKIREEFRCSAAYNKLYIKLASDDAYAALFINGIMPESSSTKVSYNKKNKMVTLINKENGQVISTESIYNNNLTNVVDLEPSPNEPETEISNEETEIIADGIIEIPDTVEELESTETSENTEVPVVE